MTFGQGREFAALENLLVGWRWRRWVDVRGRQVAMMATAVSIMETVHVNMVSFFLE
jgi:hypothetical protein